MTDAYIFSEIDAACLSRVKTNFLSLPVIGMNDGAKDLDLSAGFVAVELSGMEVERIGVNFNPLTRTYGAVVIDVNVPVNTGTSLAMQYSDTLAKLFRAQDLTLANGHLRFTEKTSVDSEGGKRHDKEGLYYLTVVTCPFYYQVYLAS